MTEAHAPEPPEPIKLLASPRMKIRLALVSGLVLGAGALLAPRAAQPGLATLPEHAAPLLEEQVQLREVPQPFRGVQDVAGRVRDHGVAMAAAREPSSAPLNDFAPAIDRSQPSGFGVFVSPTQVLTHALAVEGRTSLQVAAGDGTGIDATVAAYEPSTGLVLLDTTASGRGAAPLAAQPPAPGMLAVAAARWEGRDLAIPLFVTSVGSDRHTVTATGEALRPGMALYNMDGELFALLAGGAQAGQAFAVAGAVDRLRARAASGEGRASFGLSFQPLTGLLARALGEHGVLVSDVVGGAPAEAAGIVPGDILIAVGTMAVDAPEEAARALMGAPLDAATPLKIVRQGRERTVTATPAPAVAVAALARADLREDAAGPVARGLLPEAAVAAANLGPEVRVLAVNGRPVSTVAAARRELARGRPPAVVLLSRDGERFLVAVEGAR